MIGSVQHLRKTRIAIGVVLVMVIIPATAGAVLSGRNGRIAFTSGREAGDAQARIYTRTVIGSSGGGILEPPISPLGGQSRHASWSPDRTKVVFANGTPGSPTTEDYDLFVKDLVTGSVTALDGTEVGDSLSSDHPAWSPDGTRIAYEHQPVDNSADRNIMIKTVGTSAAATSLTTDPALEFKPAWSPDSQTIYYAKTVSNPNPDYNIMRKPAAGGAEVGVLTASGIDEYQPSISPDGSQICFTLQTVNNTATADIYITSLPTPGFLNKMSPDGTNGDINCTFSPDGTKIAYVNGVFSQGKLVMKLISDPTGQPVLLEDDVGSDNFDGNPDWAPDGSPDCPDSTVTTPPDTPITIPLECTDTGPLYEQTDPNGFVANGGQPTHGTTSNDAPLDNPSTVKYTPNPGFTGTDTIVFTSFDSFGFGTDKGTVTINVKAPTGNGGGGGGTTDGKVDCDLDVAKKQKGRKVRAGVACRKSTVATIEGKVVVPPKGSKPAAEIPLASQTKTIAAGRATVLKLKPKGRKNVKALKRALKRGEVRVPLSVNLAEDEGDSIELIRVARLKAKKRK